MVAAGSAGRDTVAVGHVRVGVDHSGQVWGSGHRFWAWYLGEQRAAWLECLAVC
jgi:hypothetical protein